MPKQLASFIDGLMTAWYSDVARWEAPGAGSECSLCVRSEVPDLLRLREWPHSATHSLVVELSRAADQTPHLLAEVGHYGLVPIAHELFVAHVAPYGDDVHDVLMECVEPEFARYVTEQAESGMSGLQDMLWGVANQPDPASPLSD